MVTDRLIERMGSVPNLPVKWFVSIRTMLNIDGDGHRQRDGTCKRAFRSRRSYHVVVDGDGGVLGRGPRDVQVAVLRAPHRHVRRSVGART